MAGRPLYRGMVAEVERRARAWHELSDDAPISPDDVIEFAVGMIESGKPIAGIAETLSVPRAKLSRYLNGLGPDATERLSRARATGAHGLAEEAILVADQPVFDSVEASAARLRVGARQWTAERWNRAELGSQVAPTIAISIHNLHLASLQSAGPRMLTAEARVIESADVLNDLEALGL